MDCAAEEQLVRLKLADLDGIERVAVDLDAVESRLITTWTRW